MRRLITAALMAIAICAVGAGGASASTANAAGNCGLTLEQAQNLGTTYVYSIKTKKVSCGKGMRIVKKYHQCRKAKPKGGARGKCTSKVKGFKCREGKRDTLPGVQYTTTANCKRGGKKVKFEYQQNF